MLAAATWQALLIHSDSRIYGVYNWMVPCTPSHWSSVGTYSSLPRTIRCIPLTLRQGTCNGVPTLEVPFHYTSFHPAISLRFGSPPPPSTTRHPPPPSP